MSTLKVNSIKSPSSSTGGIEIDSSGAITGALPYPNRNLLYNGAMQVHQRGTSATGITSGDTYYTADRWKIFISNAGTWTQSVEDDAPTGSGLRKSLRMLCTTADANLAAGDYVGILQILEGQDLQRIRKGTASAQKLTLSFWIKSTVTGTYVVELSDNNNNRRVSATYTVLSSNTWERKVITFPEDITGAFNNDNAAALSIEWWIAAGSTWTSGTLQTSWGSPVNGNRAVGQVNAASANNNAWLITGVQLEVGDVATDFEFKSQGQEVAECQRYYVRFNSENGNSRIPAFARTVGAGPNSSIIVMLPTMRAKPAGVDFSGIRFSDDVTFDSVAASTVTLTSSTCTRNAAQLGATFSVNPSLGSGYSINLTGTGFLGLSAEL